MMKSKMRMDQDIEEENESGTGYGEEDGNEIQDTDYENVNE